MLSFGALIWISLRPLLRLAICVSAGFIITKADVFPAIAARGASQVILNITLPCLLFSKIVPAFTSDNVRAFGPLVLVAVLYEIIGIAFAWIIKQFFWVPHRFRYGFLVAGGWGNIGDIPTSVVMSVTGAAPFHAATDQNLSVAYISVFILVFMVTLFPLGGHRWIAMDYVGPEVEHDETREAMRLKWTDILSRWRGPQLRPEAEDIKNTSNDAYDQQEKSNTGVEGGCNEKLISRVARHSSHKCPIIYDDTTVIPTESFASPTCSHPPTELDVTSRIDIIEITAANSNECRPSSFPNSGTILPPSKSSPLPTASLLPGSSRSRRFHFALCKFQEFCKGLFNPASVAIFISFPIALIPKLKALFVNVPGTNIPAAPDGQPPLAFIMDTTTFMGGASIPLGLVCLGSALARLNVPRNRWRTLPLGAISCLAIGKLLLLPIIGILMCQGLVKAGVISETDRVLRFVCIFCSCLPTATTQVFLTQVYSGTGSAEDLSAFLIPQYILMFFSMTALTAYSIQLIF